MTPANCDLCGLPLRFGAVAHATDDQSLRFCCQGCRMVYRMLLESAGADDPTRFKQTDLYRQCVAAGVIPASEDDLRRIADREKRETRAAAASIEGLKASAEPSDTLALDLIV
ncbi:MAG: hypothetical protein V2I40_14025, partial [Desulfobacteraceae bacterium]|nr:hypothetical protein [Desulfobacteraceae bacterium]